MTILGLLLLLVCVVLVAILVNRELKGVLAGLFTLGGYYLIVVMLAVVALWLARVF